MMIKRYFNKKKLMHPIELDDERIKVIDRVETNLYFCRNVNVGTREIRNLLYMLSHTIEKFAV
jgi:hypothetical protein